MKQTGTMNKYVGNYLSVADYIMTQAPKVDVLKEHYDQKSNYYMS
jgi:hypothetical protein